VQVIPDRQEARPLGLLFRRRRTWALIAGVVLMALLFARLSQWQWDRHVQRDATNAAIRSALAAPPVLLTEVLPAPDASGAVAPTAATEWRRVTVSGRYDSGRALLVRYRSLDSNPGFEVLAPLVTPTGTVWIDRGWIPAPAGASAEPAAPPLPTGPVEVSGYLRASEPAAGTLDPASGSVRTITLPGLNDWLGRPAYPMYVSATGESPEPTGLPKRLPMAELSGGPHVSYAVQWVLFALLALGGLVKFLGDDLNEIRAAAGAGTVAAAGPETSGPDVAGGARPAGPTSR
jgi:cytochrome oxidase assembly protein ShyY1